MHLSPARSTRTTLPEGRGFDSVAPHPVRVLLTRSGLVLTAGLLLGGLTSWGQTVLPASLAPFANSASGWTIVTVLLLWRIGSGVRSSALLGALAFAGLTVGYGMISTARGFFFDPSFWVAVGLVAGPVVGAAVALARLGSDRTTAIARGLLIGLVAGDGIYGLTVVAETTGPEYWVAAVSLAGVALIVSLPLFRRRPRVLAALLATASAVSAAYPLALLALSGLLLL